MKSLIFLIAFLPILCHASLSSTKVTIDDSGYVGVVIAIHPDVPESTDLIDDIKRTWTDASKVLFVATENRAYFKQVTILVPKTWSSREYGYAEGSENYDQADVIIAPENPAHGNEPYTIQHDGCGKPGIRSHFTPDYLQRDHYLRSYGSRGKVVVHEWAHYRWGVFDETSQETPFYLDPTYGLDDGPEATKCPSDLSGDILKVVPGFPRCTFSDIDKETNSYRDDCVFFPHENQRFDIHTSMMSYHYMDEVIKFCKDANESDSHNAHNIFAPNLQNRICSMRSTWSVIKGSSDYLMWEVRTDRNEADILPQFNVVKSQALRFVLVLDDSGSMGRADCDGVTRYDCLKVAVNVFIADSVPSDSYVGIVSFGNSGFIMRELTLVSSEQDRSDLIDSVKSLSATSGGTCIGCGISYGLEVLENDGKTAAGGNLIVITDGEDTSPSDLLDASNTVLEKGVIVETVFIVNEGNSVLKELSKNSGGEQFFAKSQSNLLQIFSLLSESDSTEDNTYQIYSDNFVLTNGGSYSAIILIDKTIGRDTVFTFTWSEGTFSPEISISSPSGCFYSSSGSHTDPIASSCGEASYETSTAFRSTRFKIRGDAETGRWKYTVFGGASNFGTITSLATSLASSNSIQPIMIESGMSTTDISDGEAAVVYAKITQGYYPVIGAIVHATVSGSSGTPKVIRLHDNGGGSDITKNDGIYSSYFTEFTGAGRYSVDISVANGPQSERALSKVGSSANYLPGYIAENGSVSVNPNGAISTEGSDSSDTGIPSQDLGEFLRVVPSESFDYTGTVNVDVPGGTITDSFPPGRVTNVKIRQNDLEDYSKGIVIQFTATGDDFDQGQAAGYDLRYTFKEPTVLLLGFNTSQKINESLMLQGNLSNPALAGAEEEFIVQTPDLPLDENGEVVNNSKLSFAVKAFDSSGNFGELSNIDVINFIIAPVVIPTAAPTEPETTTLKEESTIDIVHTTTSLQSTAEPATTEAMEDIATKMNASTMVRASTAESEITKAPNNSTTEMIANTTSQVLTTTSDCRGNISKRDSYFLLTMGLIIASVIFPA